MTSFKKFVKNPNPLEVDRQRNLRDKISSCVTLSGQNYCWLNCGYFKEKIPYDNYPIDYDYSCCPDYILLKTMLNDRGIYGIENAPICSAYDLIDKNYTGIEICYNSWTKQIEFSRYSEWF